MTDPAPQQDNTDNQEAQDIQNEHVPDPDSEQQDAASDAAQAPHTEQDALHARITALEDELAKAKDTMVRAVAEADNTRKRLAREKQDTAKFATSGFARDLLPVLDNLGRALASIPEEERTASDALKNIYTGVDMTQKELLRIMGQHGVKKIESQGQPFDPNCHEVMVEVDTTDSAPGTIVHVMEEGYMIHDRLLRPARVGVAKNDAPADNTGVDTEV